MKSKPEKSRRRSALDDLLDRLQLHLGHDYRRRDQDADGATTAVYMLGASETTVQRLRTLLPEHDFIERDRRPGVGDPSDRLRVDIVPKLAAALRPIAQGAPRARRKERT